MAATVEKSKRKIDWRIETALWTGLAAFVVFGPKFCIW
jgi:hypothetical protein